MSIAIPFARTLAKVQVPKSLWYRAMNNTCIMYAHARSARATELEQCTLRQCVGRMFTFSPQEKPIAFNPLSAAQGLVLLFSDCEEMHNRQQQNRVVGGIVGSLEDGRRFAEYFPVENHQLVIPRLDLILFSPLTATKTLGKLNKPRTFRHVVDFAKTVA